MLDSTRYIAGTGPRSRRTSATPRSRSASDRICSPPTPSPARPASSTRSDPQAPTHAAQLCQPTGLRSAARQLAVRRSYSSPGPLRVGRRGVALPVVRGPRWCAHGGGPPEVIRADFGMDTAAFCRALVAYLDVAAPAPLRPLGRASDRRRSSKVLGGHLTLKRPSGLTVKDVVCERGYRGDRSAAQIPVSEMRETDPMTCISARAPSTVPASRREGTPRTGLPVDRDRGDWRLLGSCRNVESSLLFSPEGGAWSGPGAARSARQTRLPGCPVLTECREYALAVAEPYGTWGRDVRERPQMAHPAPDNQ